MIQRGGHSASWLGRVLVLDGVNSSSAVSGEYILSVYEDSWLANIRVGSSSGVQYEVRPSTGRGGVHHWEYTLQLVDVSMRYDIDDGLERVSTGLEALKGKATSVSVSVNINSKDFGPTLSVFDDDEIQIDNDDILDVGVLWTPQALAAVGGASAMANLVNLAIDESNTILINSDVSLRVRLASARQINDSAYVEPISNAFSTMFFDLLDTADGVFDVDTNVRRLEDGADVLVLLVADGSFCGVGAQIGSDDDDKAFSVVAQACATGAYSFIHEIGHNLGAHHDFVEGR